MDNIKILIADDHQIILDGLRLLLNQEEGIKVIAEVTDGEQVINEARKAQELDVILLDINMPKLDGIEVTRLLKTEFPEISILIMTMYNRKEFIRSLIEVGVDGYILKNSGKKELLSALQALSKGEPYFGKEITRTIMKSYQKSRVFDNPMEIELTSREKEIIQLIGDGLNTAEIGEKLFLSTHTINTHRKNILSKLNVKNSVGVIRFGIQTGIIKGFDL